MRPETIAEAIPEKEGRQIHWATVTQASPLLVKFAGDTSSMSVAKLTGYSPTLAEQVVIIKVGSRWVAIGGVA